MASSTQSRSRISPLKKFLLSVIAVAGVLMNSPVDGAHDESKMSMFYSDGQRILAVHPGMDREMVMFSNADQSTEIVAFDFDVEDGALFVVTKETAVGLINATKTQIVKVTTGGHSRVLFRDNLLSQVVDLSVDWVTKNLFLIENNGSNIVVCRTDRPFCADLFTKRDGARSLVVDPQRGLLFWSENHGRIYQGSGNGKVSFIYAMEDTSSPIDLRFDGHLGRLYWHVHSTGKIHFIQVANGTQSHVDLPTQTSPAGWAVSHDRVFWAENSGNHTSLMTCPVDDCETSASLGELKNSTCLKMKATTRPMQDARRNPCHKRSCQHICVVTGRNDTDFGCLCPRRFSKAFCEVKAPSFYVAAGSQLLELTAESALNGALNDVSVLSHIPRFASMVVDDVGAALYAIAIDGQSARLVSVDLNNGRTTKLVKTCFRNSSSLLFDPFNRLLFWLEPAEKVVAVYNVDRRELTRLRLQRGSVDAEAVDLAVDFRRGQLYVLYGDGKNSTGGFIQRHNLAGELEPGMPPVTFRPSKITVDQTTGNIIAFDQDNEGIYSFNVDSGNFWLIAQDVSGIHELQPWAPRVFWTATDEAGFFVATAGEPNITHVLHESWTAPTQAVALSGLKMDSVQSDSCSKARCSHTCIESISEHVCICPEGMHLGEDGASCEPQECPGGLGKFPDCSTKQIRLSGSFSIEWNFSPKTIYSSSSAAVLFLVAVVFFLVYRNHRRSRSMDTVHIRLEKLPSVTLAKF